MTPHNTKGDLLKVPLETAHKPNERLLHLELLRIIACFLVILNHTTGYINCFVYDKSYITPELIRNLFIGMLVKINVPLFYMITGSLLLGKDRDYSYVFRKAVKTFGILLLFSLIANFCNQGRIYIPGFIRGFATAKVDGAGPYWYLYAYLGILLILPFMRSIAARLSFKDVIYIVIARVIITGFIPMIFMFLNVAMDTNIYIADEFNPVLFTVDCIFYPIVGFGLDRLIDEDKLDKLNAYSFILLFLGANVLEIFLTWIAGLDNVYRGFDFLMAIGVFMFVKLVMGKRAVAGRKENVSTKSRLASFIGTVGGLTFGIYLLDPIVGNYLKPFVFGIDKSGNHLLVMSFVYCIISMVVCGVIVLAFKKICKK